MKLSRFFCPLGVFLLFAGAAWGAVSQPIALWPGRAPDETKALPPEADNTKAADKLIAGKAVVRLGNVANPTLTIYSPRPLVTKAVTLLWKAKSRTPGKA